MKLDSISYRSPARSLASSTKAGPINTATLNRLNIDGFQLRFQGKEQKAQKPKSLWPKLVYGPVPKLLAGTLLLGTGIAIKVLGLATVLGAPLLVPLGLGIAGIGTILMGWGGIQLFKRTKENASKPNGPINHTVEKTKEQKITSDQPIHLALQPEQPISPPSDNDDQPILPPVEKTKEQKITSDQPIHSALPPEQPISPHSDRDDQLILSPPPQSNRDEQDNAQEEPLPPEYAIGSRALSCVLQNVPSITEDALNEFFDSIKGSDAAVKAGEKLDLFLKHDSSPNQYCPNGRTPLANAALHNRPWLVSRLSKTPGFKPNRECLFGPTGLKMALLRDDAKLLIPALDKADPVDKDTLQWAASCGQPEVFRKLIERSPGILSSEEQDQLLSLANSQKEQVFRYKSLTPSELKYEFWENLGFYIHDTAEVRHNDPNILVAILRAGTNVNEYNFGNTPLNLACFFGNNQAVKALLAAGADTTKANEPLSLYNFKLPLSIASSKGHEDVVKNLLQTGLDPNEPCRLYPNSSDRIGAPLLAAIEGRHGNIVDILLQAGAQVNQTNALYEAARLGQDQILQTLLKAGAHVNAGDCFERSPLYMASRGGHENAVQTLLEAKNIDVNLPDHIGRTPLHVASTRGHINIVSQLLNAPGININQPDMDGYTPLTQAESFEEHNIAQLLRAHGAIG